MQNRISLVLNATNENSLSRSKRYKTPNCHSTLVMLHTLQFSPQELPPVCWAQREVERSTAYCQVSSTTYSTSTLVLYLQSHYTDVMKSNFYLHCYRAKLLDFLLRGPVIPWQWPDKLAAALKTKMTRSSQPC